jgi:hypothetical protein
MNGYYILWRWKSSSTSRNMKEHYHGRISEVSVHRDQIPALFINALEVITSL